MQRALGRAAAGTSLIEQGKAVPGVMKAGQSGGQAIGRRTGRQRVGRPFELQRVSEPGAPHRAIQRLDL